VSRIIAIANQKGGVGKTTTAINLGACLAVAEKRTLVIDTDPQGNATSGLGIDKDEVEKSIYDVLLEEMPIEEVILREVHFPYLDVVPATRDLVGAEVELVNRRGREIILRRAVEAVRDRYDFILIDCPPSLGLLTLNTLAASDSVLIPIQCEFYALEGLGQLLRNVDLIRGHLNAALTVTTIVLTMYDGRTKLADQVATEVRGHFGNLVLDSMIPRSVRISEAPGYGQTVLTYDPTSRGAVAYLDAAREVAERGATMEGTR